MNFHEAPDLFCVIVYLVFIGFVQLFNIYSILFLAYLIQR